MSAEGKISVIVPNYNYAHYLPELLACLQQQNYPNWECIIVDDGSSDNSIELRPNSLGAEVNPISITPSKNIRLI